MGSYSCGGLFVSFSIEDCWQGAFRICRYRGRSRSGASKIRPDGSTRPRSVPGLPESRGRRRGRLKRVSVVIWIMLAPSHSELKVKTTLAILPVTVLVPNFAAGTLQIQLLKHYRSLEVHGAVFSSFAVLRRVHPRTLGPLSMCGNRCESLRSFEALGTRLHRPIRVG